MTRSLARGGKRHERGCRRRAAAVISHAPPSHRAISRNGFAFAAGTRGTLRGWPPLRGGVIPLPPGGGLGVLAPPMGALGELEDRKVFRPALRRLTLSAPPPR